MRSNASRLWLLVVVLMVAIGFSACARDKAVVADSAPKTVSHFFSIKVGDKSVRMQLAVLDPEQERGLMNRRDLGKDDGMLFVYAKPQQMHFWMRNTPTPLDIGFFSEDGTLLEIYPMQPFDESTVSSRSSNVKYCLEMNQGWFRENAVRAGAKLDLKTLTQALKERGFEPRKFGLDGAGL